MPIKNKEETYQAITELIRDSDYTTGNLLDYEYFSNHYKLIAIDLSQKTNKFCWKIRTKCNNIFYHSKTRTNSFKLFTKFC